jgi:FkbM family methyltransferase
MKTGDITQWFADSGDHTLRVNYNLDENSIVFDLGGYHGEWADKIFTKYGCTVYIFEPINSLYEGIVKKFSNNEKIKVFNFGISDINEKRFISLENDGSSFYKSSGNEIECEVKSITEFLKEEEINKIHLMKINVEGDEFKIIEKILNDKIVNIFDNLQVQFHEFYPNSRELRLQLHDELSQTHHLTYNYEFVWENWEKNHE